MIRVSCLVIRENHGGEDWFAPEEMSEGRRTLACMSHHPTVEARDTTARTSLRLLAVLNVPVKYACARQAARAFFLRPACA